MRFYSVPLVIAGTAAVLRITATAFRCGAPRTSTDAAGRLGLRSYYTTLSTQALPPAASDASGQRPLQGYGPNARGRETGIFDSGTGSRIRAGKGDRHELTCALLSLDAPVPVVVIRRAYLGRRLLTGSGGKGALATGDRAFDRRFELNAEGQDAVSRVLNDPVRSALLDDQTLHLAQIGESVLYCTRRIDFGPRRELLERATRLRDAVR